MTPLTPQQKIELLATHPKVMGWEKENQPWGYWKVGHDGLNSLFEEESWNPLTDENHFHQCLLEVMKDERLITRYIFLITKKEFNWEKQDLIMTMKLSLPERVDKLIEALNSLPSKQ